MLPPGKYNIVFYTMYWKTYIPFKIPTKNHNPQNMFAENSMTLTISPCNNIYKTATFTIFTKTDSKELQISHNVANCLQLVAAPDTRGRSSVV